MGGVTITEPGQDQIVDSGQPFTVGGVAADGWRPEPHSIQSVTITIDGGSPIDATDSLKLLDHNHFVEYTYSAQVQITGTAGSPHVIAVTAIDDIGLAATATVTVFVDAGPLDSQLTGDATVRTSNSNALGPFNEPNAIFMGLHFSTDRQTVTVTSFAPFTSVTHQSGLDITVDVTWIPPGGTGPFNQALGTMTIPLSLNVHVVVVVTVGPTTITLHDGHSTLNLMMTTGTESSPTGAFNDTGSPLTADGSITLIGDGQFSGDNSGLGGSDASLVINGKIVPHP